jgi:predicted dehydrogenase
MNKKLNIAFIGGGLNSAVGRAHYTAITMDGYFDLVAGCFSRNADVNQQTAQTYRVNASRVYENYEQLIVKEKASIDAVVILTPTPAHFEEVQYCLDADIPVICEKALAVSSQQIQQIQQKLQQRSGFLAVTYNYTGYPMLRELKEMISSGKLGKLEQIHIEMPQEGFSRVNADGMPNRPQAWRLHDEHLPTISLDLGVHLHHIVSFLTQEKPIELVASQQSFGHFKQVVDNVSCLAHYTNGLAVNIWYSKSALGYRNGLRIRVFGEQGSAEWHQMEAEQLVVSDCHGNKMIQDRSNQQIDIANETRYMRFKAGHPAGYVEAFANHYIDIYQALRDYIDSNSMTLGSYVFGAHDAIEGLQMLEAISLSVSEKRWISL